MKLQTIKPDSSLAVFLQTLPIEKMGCSIGDADIVFKSSSDDRTARAQESAAKAAWIAAGAAAVSAVVAVTISLKIKTKEMLLLVDPTNIK